MKLQGPIELEMKVSITNGEGVSGTATIGLGNGSYPTEEKMRKALAEFEADGMPEGFRLMTKREWWDTVVPPTVEEDEDGEVYTSRFAIPGDEHDWDA